jgi:hypothetical protein
MSPSYRSRQPEGEVGEGEYEKEGDELKPDEGDGAVVDVRGGDSGGCHALEEEQRPAERRRQEQGLQVEADEDAEPDEVDAGVDEEGEEERQGDG